MNNSSAARSFRVQARKWVLAATLAALAGTASAGEYTGKMRPFFSGAFLYIEPIAAAVANKPTCATRPYLRLEELDANDPVFRGKLSMLLTSWIARRDVRLVGRGTCTQEGDEVIYIVMPL